MPATKTMAMTASVTDAEILPFPPLPKDRDAMLAEVSAIAATDVRGLAVTVDREGLYPEDNLRKLGRAGAYAQHLAGFGYSPASLDLPDAIEAMAVVGAECGCSSFLMWLQDAFGWYLLQTENAGLRAELLPAVARGEVLGTSGMSNPVKAMDDIERFKLKGRRVDGGYVVSGTLPFVSHLGDGHWLGSAFQDVDDPGHRVMAAFQVDGEAVRIRRSAHFIGLEGSGTYSVAIREAFVPDARILADPIEPFVKRIKPAFFLMQVGMAVGQIRACVNLMRRADKATGHVNQYLPERADFFEDELARILPGCMALAETPLEDSPEYLKQVFEARLYGGELTMRAANAMLMHEGARGYVQGSVADRLFRESLFVAIVTPAVKHLRKAIADCPV